MIARPAPRPLALLTATLLALSPTPTRAIDFTFFFTDPDGQGFFDPATGAQRRAALNAASDIIGQLIRPSFIGEEVVVRVNSFNNPASDTLASAKPKYYYGNFGSADPRYLANTHYTKALASHLAGYEIDPPEDDMTMTVNFGTPFYFGTDAAVPAGQYDFISVAAHELIHGLGFTDSFRSEGGFGYTAENTSSTDSGQSGLPLIYDRFITVGPNGAPILSLNSDGRKAALSSNNLYWGGPSGIDGAGGTPPKLEAPSPFVFGSNVAHLDAVRYPNDIMSPFLDRQQITQTVSPITRGILRDIGWTISVSSSGVNWVAPSPADNRASTPSNWSQTPYPGDSLTFGPNPAGVHTVNMDLQLYSLGQLQFPAAAPAYTLRFRSYTHTDLTTLGVNNQGAAPHTIILETYGDDVGGSGTVPEYTGSAASLHFRNSSTAANTIFHVHAGFTAIHQVPNSPPSFDRYSGASVSFENAATAASATFHIGGATGNGSPTTHGRVEFFDSANAGTATFNNDAGHLGVSLPLGTFSAGFGARTNFYQTSRAASATFNNLALNNGPGGTAGITAFYHSSTAQTATFNNFGSTDAQGLGGTTLFADNATAASATFNNHPSPFPGGVGTTIFTGSATPAPAGILIDRAAVPAPAAVTSSDSATAASATFNNLAGTGFLHAGGATRFYGTASASTATFNNFGSTPGSGGFGGVTEFRESSSAATATLINHLGSNGGRTEFYDNATAANAHLIIPAQSLPGTHSAYVLFRDASTAGSANLSVGAFANSAVDFQDTSTAGSATITLAPNSGTPVRFYGSATAANATIDLGHNSQLQFYTASNAGSANITVRSYANLSFAGDFNPQNNPTVSAANATIRLLGGTTSTFWGGAANFSTWSTAGNATFVVDGATAPNTRGGSVNFDYSAHMGSATITLGPATQANSPGGELYVRRGATGPDARVFTSPGSLTDFSGNSAYGGTSLGHIEGPGAVVLGGAELRVGFLGLPATLSGPVVSGSGFLGGALTKVGPATLTLAGPNDYDGLTTVSQGLLRLAGSNAKPGAYTVAPGAALEFLSTHTIASLDAAGPVTFAAPVRLAPGSAPSSLANFIIAAGGSIDLTDNPLTLAPLTPAQARDLILTSKLTSTTPDPNNLTSLGYLFSGPPGQALIHLTLTGDANLNGTIDADDFALIDRGFATQGQSWSDGDFNYDGAVTSADYLLIDRTHLLLQAQGFESMGPALLAQRASQFGPTYVSQLLTSIPEPSLPLLSTLCLLLSPLTPRRAGPPSGADRRTQRPGSGR